MSTWTNVTDTVLEPGQPIRSVDIIAIKNNILAVPAGAAGAPRVQTAAIANNAVTTAKIANNAVTTAKIANNAVTTAKIANDAVTTAKLVTNERMTTTNVLSATAGASVGAVGTYALLRNFSNNFTLNPGVTVAGSTLGFSSSSTLSGASPSGTWRVMGIAGIAADGVIGNKITVFLRIS